MRKIYTVGDSHCWHAWLKVPGVEFHTRGPMTMYSFGRDRGNVLEDIPDNSIVVFCWGEIDCRCHVYLHLPYKECIDELVREYTLAIKENIEGRNIIPFVFLVSPPARKEISQENCSFPFLGTDEERKVYVNYMNNLLRCFPSEGIGVVDVYDQYCDAEGFLIRDKSDGHVHIADEKPLIEFINKNMVDL